MDQAVVFNENKGGDEGHPSGQVDGQGIEPKKEIESVLYYDEDAEASANGEGGQEGEDEEGGEAMDAAEGEGDGEGDNALYGSGMGTGPAEAPTEELRETEVSILLNDFYYNSIP